MLSLRLDPELDRVLERDVDDLARYNILRFLHDNPTVRGDVALFADRLGLRSIERAEEALSALVQRGYLNESTAAGGVKSYSLSNASDILEVVERLYGLSATGIYGEIVEKLAARSLHRARRSQPARGMVQGDYPN